MRGVINIKLTEWEKSFLEYYYFKFSSRWVRVFNNKHPIIDTRVDLYTIYKRKLKNQPIASQVTYSNMFKSLDEGKWYLIKDLLQEGGSTIEEQEERKECEEK